jgi:hypothetical protein
MKERLQEKERERGRVKETEMVGEKDCEKVIERKT